MLYIIGGVPRSGKSTVRKQLLEKYKIPGIELETIQGMLDRAMPELSLKKDIADEDIPEKMWPWIISLIEERRSYQNDFYVLEGDYFTPESLVAFKDAPDCKVCFMVYADISAEDKLYNVRFKNGYTSDWTKPYTDEDLKPLLEKYIETSNRYKKMCQLLGIEYFDTSDDFEGKIEEAVQYLIGR